MSFAKAHRIFGKELGDHYQNKTQTREITLNGNLLAQAQILYVLILIRKVIELVSAMHPVNNVKETEASVILRLETMSETTTNAGAAAAVKTLKIVILLLLFFRKRQFQ
jgi:hypothetical protein